LLLERVDEASLQRESIMTGETRIPGFSRGCFAADSG